MENLDIRRILCLDKAGYPTCEKTKYTGSLEQQIKDQVDHLREKRGGNSAEVNEVSHYICPRGTVQKDKLRQMLKRGSKTPGPSCCPHNIAEIPRSKGRPSDAAPPSESKQLESIWKPEDDVHITLREGHPKRTEQPTLQWATLERDRDTYKQAMNSTDTFNTLGTQQPKADDGQPESRGVSSLQMDCPSELHVTRAGEAPEALSAGVHTNNRLSSEFKKRKRRDAARDGSLHNTPKATVLREEEAPTSPEHEVDTQLVTKRQKARGTLPGSDPDPSQSKLSAQKNNHKGGHQRDVVVIEDNESPQSSPNVPRPLFYLPEESLSSLASQRWARDDVLFSITRIVQAAVDPQLVRIFDTYGNYAQRQGRPTRSTVLLLPIHVNTNHWVVAKVRKGWDEIDIYDSLPLEDHKLAAEEKIRKCLKVRFNEDPSPSFSYTSPVLQKDHNDCGVAAMVTLLHLALGQIFEPGTDLPMWRRVLTVLLGQNKPLATGGKARKMVAIPDPVRDVAQKGSVSSADCGSFLAGIFALLEQMAPLPDHDTNEAMNTVVYEAAMKLICALRKRVEERQTEHREEVIQRLGWAQEELEAYRVEQRAGSLRSAMERALE